MNKDQIKGRVEEVKGKVKEVAGEITGDASANSDDNRSAIGRHVHQLIVKPLRLLVRFRLLA